MNDIEKLAETEKADLHTLHTRDPESGEWRDTGQKALRIIDAQAARITELAVEFDRLYGDARSASSKLEVSVDGSLRRTVAVARPAQLAVRIL